MRLLSSKYCTWEVTFNVGIHFPDQILKGPHHPKPINMRSDLTKIARPVWLIWPSGRVIRCWRCIMVFQQVGLHLIQFQLKNDPWITLRELYTHNYASIHTNVASTRFLQSSKWRQFAETRVSKHHLEKKKSICIRITLRVSCWMLQSSNTQHPLTLLELQPSTFPLHKRTPSLN